MNDVADRLRKMTVLARLRLLERDRQAFHKMRCQSEHDACEHELERRLENYHAAHSPGAFNPDTYEWRLSGIEALRHRVSAAGVAMHQAGEALNIAQHQLVRKEIEKKMADKVEVESRHDFMRDFQLKEQAESLDFQLFRRRLP